MKGSLNEVFLMHTSNGDGSFACSKIDSMGRFVNPVTEPSGSVCDLVPLDVSHDGACDLLRQGNAASSMNNIDTVSVYFSDDDR